MGLMLNITDTDAAWFAAWLSADGSIMDAGGGRPRIRFTITDRDPLDRFAELFGNKVGGPHEPSGLGRKTRYDWQVSGQRAQEIIERVWPWLTDRRQARYIEITKDWSLQEHKGRKLSPEQVATIKQELKDGGHGIVRRLSAEYGVSEGLISAIRHGRAWKETT